MTPRISELLTWGAIGARTVESPLHRQMASALSAPVGFKNATNGSVSTAIDGILLESHLVEGRQDLRDGRKGLRYGQSVTDACIGWDATASALERLAESVEHRRRAHAAVREV